MSLIAINRGDGACGKTSLLNVFTRGQVADSSVSPSYWAPLLILPYLQILPHGLRADSIRELCTW